MFTRGNNLKDKEKQKKEENRRAFLASLPVMTNAYTEAGMPQPSQERLDQLEREALEQSRIRQAAEDQILRSQQVEESKQQAPIQLAITADDNAHSASEDSSETRVLVPNIPNLMQNVSTFDNFEQDQQMLSEQESEGTEHVESHTTVYEITSHEEIRQTAPSPMEPRTTEIVPAQPDNAPETIHTSTRRRNRNQQPYALPAQFNSSSTHPAMTFQLQELIGREHSRIKLKNKNLRKCVESLQERNSRLERMIEQDHANLRESNIRAVDIYSQQRHQQQATLADRVMKSYDQRVDDMHHRELTQARQFDKLLAEINELKIQLNTSCAKHRERDKLECMLVCAIVLLVALLLKAMNMITDTYHHRSE